MSPNLTKETYDSLGRLANVLANGAQAAAYGFDTVGNLEYLRYGDGVTNLYQYDARNRLTNLVWNLNGTRLAGFAYQLDAVGARVGLSENVSGVSRGYAWTYDGLRRLTAEQISGGAASSFGYGYDPAGNRTNRSSTVSALPSGASVFDRDDRLAGDSYDANGNTTLSASGVACQYDAENRLTNYNGGAVVLRYDGDGNRVSKTVGWVTTYYVVDDRNPSGYAQAVEEITSQNSTGVTLQRVRNYGLGLISQRQAGSGNTVSYYGVDGHGSTRFLADATGAVTDTYTYDAYGNLIGQTGSTANNNLYCGEQWDPDLGMHYLRARYFNPQTGRFWTMDTYEGNNEDPRSLHKYLYCQGNPVNGKDPSGFEMDWDSYFGYEAEHAIQEEYEATHAGDGAAYGAQQSTGASFLMPDIFNAKRKTFLEIKPISMSGITKGVAKMGVDAAAFGKLTLGFSPEASWQPRSHLLYTDDDGAIFVINVDGLVLYKSVKEIEWKLITVSSIKVANDLLPYLYRLGVSELKPVVTRMALRAGMAVDAMLDDYVGIASENACLGGEF